MTASVPAAPGPGPGLPSQKTKKVNASSPFGGSVVSDALGLLLFPFVMAAFWVITPMEMLMDYGRRLLWPSSGPPRRPRPGLKGEQPIEFFDPDILMASDWARLRDEYVHRGVPFVLQRAGNKPLSSVAPPVEAVTDATASGCIRVVTTTFLGPLPGLDELCAKLFPWSPRAYWPLWFLGRYSQGTAHVDLGPHVFNCYFLRSGSKDVLLAPPEVARDLDLAPGLDGLYIPESADEKRAYARSLPYYYRVDLPPQSMLCFNNTSTLHQFRNQVGTDGAMPEALSIRIKHTCCGDLRVWRQMTLPWRAVKPIWRFTGVFVAAGLLNLRSEDRDAKYI